MNMMIIAFFVISVISFAKCDLNLPEGAACLSNGRNGTCVNLFKCHFTAIAYKFIQAGIKTESLPEICSYRPDGEPVICCLECTLDNSETMKWFDVMDGRFYRNEGSVSWKKCIEYYHSLPYACRGESPYYLESRSLYKETCDRWELINEEDSAYGGEPAKRWEFPHMALLGYGQTRDSAQWLCGGSVISEYFILTAAHCLSTPALGNISFAALSLLKRSDSEEYWKVYKIVEAIPHPEYKSPSKYHDIALLRTENEINFGRGLLPACLPTGTSPYSADAAGWGRQGPRQPLADVLQVMHLIEYSEKDCTETFPKHRLMENGYNHSTQMCYGRRDAIVDTCEGDSGGPLQRELSDCIFIIHGITSFGKDCGLPGNAGMYTRVKHYVPWIESIVWPGE